MSPMAAYFARDLRPAPAAGAALSRRPRCSIPRTLLNDLLGSQIPGTGSTVRDKAGKATQLAKDNPLAAGALVAVLLGTGTGRAGHRHRR